MKSRFSNNLVSLTHAWDENSIKYDVNSNIQALRRDSSVQGTLTANSGILIDQLKYTYNSSITDQLYTVYDSSASAKGFIGGATGSHYTYDANGNLTSEPYQGITGITYNVLNRTDSTKISGTTYITYTYDAGGMLLRKKAYNSGTLTQTDYIGGFVYTGNGTTQTLAYAPMPEGRLLGVALTQEFVITDPQGNARVAFQNVSGVAKVTQENSYYGYGLLMPGSLVGWSAPPNKNLYNGGSEWQNDTKAINAGVPDYYQTFYRNYDPALARFVAVDPMVEGAESMGVFQYAGDDPIMMNDPGGNKALPPGAWQNVAQDNAAQAAFQGPSDLAGGGGPSAEDVWQELRQGYGPDIIASGTSSDPNFLQNFVHDVGPYLISGALAMANSVNYSFNSDGQLISVNPNGLGHNTFTKQVITNLGTMTDPNTGYDWYQNVSITDVPITAEEAAAFGLTGADANQGGGGILGWIGNHFLEEGSYQLTVGYQFSGGIKHGVDATINLESSVLSEGKIGNRNVEGENKTYDNSKWTHELSLSWAGVGGGVKYTNNDNTEKELEFSAGILGFLGGKIAIDPSNGQVTNWFIGIDIDVHVAAIFGIDGEYKLGLAK